MISNESTPINTPLVHSSINAKNNSDRVKKDLNRLERQRGSLLLFCPISETRNPIPPTYYAKASPQTYTLTRVDGFDGLGILVATDAETRSQHFIREVEPGSPGHRAGLRKNDRIISVNNVSTENMDFSNVLLLIKQGLDNARLQITVIHELDSI